MREFRHGRPELAGVDCCRSVKLYPRMRVAVGCSVAVCSLVASDAAEPEAGYSLAEAVQCTPRVTTGKQVYLLRTVQLNSCTVFSRT